MFSPRKFERTPSTPMKSYYWMWSTYGRLIVHSSTDKSITTEQTNCTTWWFLYKPKTSCAWIEEASSTMWVMGSLCMHMTYLYLVQFCLLDKIGGESQSTTPTLSICLSTSLTSQSSSSTSKFSPPSHKTNLEGRFKAKFQHLWRRAAPIVHQIIPISTKRTTLVANCIQHHCVHALLWTRIIYWI